MGHREQHAAFRMGWTRAQHGHELPPRHPQHASERSGVRERLAHRRPSFGVGWWAVGGAASARRVRHPHRCPCAVGHSGSTDARHDPARRIRARRLERAASRHRSWHAPRDPWHSREPHAAERHGHHRRESVRQRSVVLGGRPADHLDRPDRPGAAPDRGDVAQRRDSRRDRAHRPEHGAGHRLRHDAAARAAATSGHPPSCRDRRSVADVLPRRSGPCSATVHADRACLPAHHRHRPWRVRLGQRHDHHP